MKQKWNIKDIFHIGDEVFIREAEQNLSRAQLQRISLGTFSDVGPYVDNVGSRALLSLDQRNHLTRRGLDFMLPPMGKRVPHVLSYIRECISLQHNDESSNGQAIIEDGPEQSHTRIPFLVVLVFTDIGDIVKYWRTDW